MGASDSGALLLGPRLGRGGSFGALAQRASVARHRIRLPQANPGSRPGQAVTGRAGPAARDHSITRRARRSRRGRRQALHSPPTRILVLENKVKQKTLRGEPRHGARGVSALDGAVRLLHRGMLRVTDVTDVTAPSRHARRADLSIGRRTPRLSGGLTTGMPRQVCLRPCRSFHSAARACTTLRQPAQAGPDGGAKVTTTPHWQARMCLLLCQTGKKRVFFNLLCFVLVVVFCVSRTA